MANCQCSSLSAFYTSEGNTNGHTDCWPTAAEALSAGSSFWVNDPYGVFSSKALCLTSLTAIQAGHCTTGPSGYAFDIRACASASPSPSPELKGLCCTFSRGTTNATDTYGCFGPTTKSSCFANNGFKWNQLKSGTPSSCINNWCVSMAPQPSSRPSSNYDCCTTPGKPKAYRSFSVLNGCVAPWYGHHPYTNPFNFWPAALAGLSTTKPWPWISLPDTNRRAHAVFDYTKYTRVNFQLNHDCDLDFSNFNETLNAGADDGGIFGWIRGRRPCGTSNLPGLMITPPRRYSSGMCGYFWKGGAGLTANVYYKWDKGYSVEYIINPSLAKIQCGDEVFTFSKTDISSCSGQNPRRAYGQLTLLAGTPKELYSSSSHSAWRYFYRNVSCTNLGSQCALASATATGGAPCCVPPNGASSGYCFITDSLTCVWGLGGTYFPSLSSCRYKMCDSLLTNPPSSSSPEALGRAHYFTEYNCKDINTLAPDVVCDTGKKQFLDNSAKRYVVVHENQLPKNGGNTCFYDPTRTFHFVINHGNSSCNLYINDKRNCSATRTLNLSNKIALDHCCECDNQSCSPYVAANSSLVAANPSIALRPGRYCFHQEFYAWPVLSAPTQKNTQAMNGSTNCEQADRCGATYKHPHPRPEIVSIRVPRLFTEAEVKGKWIALDPKGPSQKHKFYKIEKPVHENCASLNGFTPTPSLPLNAPTVQSSTPYYRMTNPRAWAMYHHGGPAARPCNQKAGIFLSFGVRGAWDALPTDPNHPVNQTGWRGALPYSGGNTWPAVVTKNTRLMLEVNYDMYPLVDNGGKNEAENYGLKQSIRVLSPPNGFSSRFLIFKDFNEQGVAFHNQPIAGGGPYLDFAVNPSSRNPQASHSSIGHADCLSNVWYKYFRTIQENNLTAWIPFPYGDHNCFPGPYTNVRFRPVWEARNPSKSSEISVYYGAWSSASLGVRQIEWPGGTRWPIRDWGAQHGSSTTIWRYTDDATTRRGAQCYYDVERCYYEPSHCSVGRWNNYGRRPALNAFDGTMHQLPKVGNIVTWVPACVDSGVTTHNAQYACGKVMGILPQLYGAALPVNPPGGAYGDAIYHPTCSNQARQCHWPPYENNIDAIINNNHSVLIQQLIAANSSNASNCSKCHVILGVT